MVEVVAIAREVLVVTTTDYVQGQAALAELIQGGQLACRQRRCDHPRAIGQENAKAPGGSGDEGTDHRALGGIAEIPHQHPVEAGVLMGLGETPDETGVHSLPNGWSTSELGVAVIMPRISTLTLLPSPGPLD